MPIRCTNKIKEGSNLATQNSKAAPFANFSTYPCSFTLKQMKYPQQNK